MAYGPVYSRRRLQWLRLCRPESRDAASTLRDTWSETDRDGTIMLADQPDSSALRASARFSRLLSACPDRSRVP